MRYEVYVNNQHRAKSGVKDETNLFHDRESALQYYNHLVNAEYRGRRNPIIELRYYEEDDYTWYELLRSNQED